MMVEVEGSVLDNYLEDLATVNQKATPYTQPYLPQMPPFKKQLFLSKGRLIAGLHEMWCAAMGHNVQNTLKHCYHHQLARKILSSPVLVEEDYEYFSLHHSNLLSKEDKIYSTVRQSESTSLCSHFFIALISIFIAVIKVGPMWSQILVSIIGALAVFNVAILKVGGFRRTKKHKQTLLLLEAFLQSSTEFRTLVQKCLRFIQEMEIAAMGYTLISGNTPINRMARTRRRLKRECVRLRYQVLKSCVDSIIYYREASLKLMNAQGHNEDLKFSVRLCQIPLQELGPCFDKENSFEELSTATDSFCLEVLRDTANFLHIQRSELLKLMCLAQFDIDRLKTLKELCDTKTNKLLNVLKAHQNVQNEMKPGTRPLQPTSKVKSPLYNAVHSTQVHLRAALRVAIQGEEALEGDPNAKILKDFLLPQLKIHLDASSQCVAESFKHLEPEAVERPPKVKFLDINKSEDEVKIDTSLLDSTENFTEDQIFEAVVDELNRPTVQNDNEEAGEFETNRKRRIEETEHVMKELQSVLRVKTSAEEREITKSKLFPTYTPKVVHQQQDCTISSTEKDETDPAENNKYDETRTINTNRVESKPDFAGAGDLAPAHELLKLPQRPAGPCRGKRKRPPKNRVFHTVQGTTNTALDADESADEEKSAVPFGFGFPSVLASQAAQVALSGLAIRNATEATFGDSDSDS